MTEATPRPVPGTPCWVSLMANDLSVSQSFYGELFGWEFQPAAQQFGPHVRAQLGSREVAGLGEIHRDRTLPTNWLPYLASDNADETCSLIRDCGGTVGVGPMDSEWGGRVAIASDTCGAAFGIWQTDGEAVTPIDGRPGTVVWNELLVPEAGLVTTFYGAVFGFRVEPLGAPEADYRTLLLRDRPAGGVRGVGAALPPDRGPLWITYFAVPDLAAAVRLVPKIGGTVQLEPRDSPYGRYARVTDPEGAPFAVIEMSDPADAVVRPLRDR